MNEGKFGVLIGALLTLVSTFFFSFGQTNSALGRTYISGIGFLFNFPEIITDVNYWVAYFGGEATVIYIVSIVLLVFLLSGIIQLVGLSNRVVAIIGSLMVLNISIAIMAAIMIDGPGMDFERYFVLLWRAPIVDGIWPLDVPIINLLHVHNYQNLSLGAFTSITGGALGLVGGILGVKDQ